MVDEGKDADAHVNEELKKELESRAEYHRLTAKSFSEEARKRVAVAIAYGVSAWTVFLAGIGISAPFSIEAYQQGSPEKATIGALATVACLLIASSTGIEAIVSRKIKREADLRSQEESDRASAFTAEATRITVEQLRDQIRREMGGVSDTSSQS